ncbi:MAG TPA: DedA family protein [Gemmataceae bacterium]|nr:DedA family protein [Gemmataceae bacterium]
MELLQQLFDLIRELTDPDRLAALLHSMGAWFYVLLFVVVFCETGLVVTPILPGDSMLFAVGAVASLAGADLNLAIILLGLIAAAVGGDAANYAIGYHVGPRVFTSERSRLFNRKHLFRTQAFYEKYGAKTIILARFVPIVRTFAPFVAGIGKMRYFQFALYNVVGGVAWVLLCVLSGYFFGNVEWVKRHFEAVLVAVVLVSVMPIAVEYLLARRRQTAKKAELVSMSAVSAEK